LKTLNGLKPNDDTGSSSNSSQPQERRRYSKNHFERYVEARLKLDYAMLRFPKSEVAFKTKDQDPRVWFTAKYIPERAQVALHLRIPVLDEWNELDEFIDLDIYFPKNQVEEIVKVLTQPTKTEHVEKIQSMTFSVRRFEALLKQYVQQNASRRSRSHSRAPSRRRRR